MLVIKNQIYIMIIKNGHCLKINHFSVAHLFFRHNLMLCRNPSFIVWNQSVFAQYNTFVTCYALNKIVEEMMHHAFGQGNKMPLSGFTVQWPLIQTVADKALTFVNYHQRLTFRFRNFSVSKLLPNL